MPYVCFCENNKSSLLVECGNISAAVVPWIVRRITRQPYAIYTYGTELVALRKRSIKNYFLKKVLSGASALYTLGSYSEGLLKLLEAQQPVTIVPPKIVLSQRKLHVKSPSPGATRVLSIGRLVKHKGFAVLIHAAAALRRRMNVTVTIIGNGPDYSRLTNLCRDLGVAQCVFIKRNVADTGLEKEFQSADLFVLPSMETEQGTEGFGIVLLEAMAYHIPVIASACGGIPEVLDNGNAGILVEPGNSNALAGAIETLAQDQDHAEQLAARAYSRLLEHYVWR
jgi:glycosyltransferase involved in cell wall biosynthesis